MLICLISNYDFAAGVQWLELRKRRGTPLDEGMSTSSVRQMLEDMFLMSDEHTLAAWADPADSPLGDSVRRTANNFARCYRLSGWVRDQNVKGVAVPTSALINQFNSSGGEAVPQSLVLLNSAGRSWASRWRGRFGGKHMRRRAEEPTSLDELRSKAAQKEQPASFNDGVIHTCFCMVLVQYDTLQSSPFCHLLGEFWFNLRAQFWGHYMTPVLGPPLHLTSPGGYQNAGPFRARILGQFCLRPRSF